MKNINVFYVILFFATNIFAQAHESVARPGFRLEGGGSIECSRDENHSCELSAAACLSTDALGGGIIALASDKPLAQKGGDAILTGRIIDNRFVSTGLLKNPSTPVNKYESLIVSPSGSHVIGITAFDREEKSYSQIIYWDTKNLHNPGIPIKIVNKQKNTPDLYVALLEVYREKFGIDINYIKIEGAGFTKAGRLLFAVRSYGKSFKEFQDAFHLLSLKIEMDMQGVPIISSDEIIFEADFTNKVNSFFGRNFGVSDIFIDKKTDDIWALVAHESGEEGKKLLDGRLLLLQQSASGLIKDYRIQVVDNVNNSPLILEGKPEGICEYSQGKFIIVYDDDRELTRPGQLLRRERLSQSRYELYIRDDRKPRFFPKN